VPIVLDRFQTKLHILSADFQKNSGIKFQEYPSSGSQVDPSGRTDGLVAFCNFMNLPKKP
jgi:hypothetical protein